MICLVYRILKLKKAGVYFDRLNESASTTTEYVHKWDGELYLELHRGTLTSQAFTKKYNRELEFFLYRETETLGVLSSLLNNKWDEYNSKVIEQGWKTILENQFHDIIPGSSIKEVYEDAKKDYEHAKCDILQLKNQIQNSIVKTSINTYSVYNNSNWVVNDVVVIRHLEKDGVFTSNGNDVPSEKIEGGHLVYLEKMEPLSYTIIAFEEKKNNP